MGVYMKVAIISDIHGNMQALEAVLDDVKKEKCDKIFCLGDLAMAGPEPELVIKKIKNMFDSGDLELIQGNTDEMIGDYAQSVSNALKSAFPIMGAALDNDVEIISKDLITFLKELPKQKELTIEGVKILLVHGSPRRNNENIFPDMDLKKIEEMLENTDADVIFCGHTHIPCGYQTTKKQTVVNVGSVGRPFTPDAKACYVIAEFNNGDFNVMHRQLNYDRQKAADILAKRHFTGADKLAQILINPEFRHI